VQTTFTSAYFTENESDNMRSIRKKNIIEKLYTLHDEFRNFGTLYIFASVKAVND